MISKLLKKNQKGFTLMEMLIVIAIIAVLIAIAIPTFTNALNKARVATDEANIRSGYASAMVELLTADEPNANKTYTLKTDGNVTGDATAYSTKGDATKVYKDPATVDIAGQAVAAWSKNQTVTYTYAEDDNALTINIGAAAGNGG